MSYRDLSMVKIRGNTYPHRDLIKSVGGVWDGDEKCWVIDFANHRGKGRGAPMNYRRQVEQMCYECRRGGCRIEEIE